MSDLEIFGPLVMGTDVEDAIKATLETWFETYLAFVEREIVRRGHKVPGGKLPLPRSYTVSSDWDHFPEEQVPAVMVMAPKMEKPRRDGKRTYRADFPFAVGIFVEGQDRSSTERLAKFYGAAIRALITGRGDLGGFANATVPTSEDWGRHISNRSQRTFGTAEVCFVTEVLNIGRQGGGPLEVPAKPKTEPGANPRLTKPNVTLSPLPLD